MDQIWDKFSRDWQQLQIKLKKKLRKLKKKLKNMSQIVLIPYK
jgi:hypothetical protein